MLKVPTYLVNQRHTHCSVILAIASIPLRLKLNPKELGVYSRMATQEPGLEDQTVSSQPYSVKGKTAIVTGAGSGTLLVSYFLQHTQNLTIRKA